MKRYITHISQMADLTTKVQEYLDKNKRGIPVTVGKPLKTWEQLAYLHSTVLPIFQQTMFDAGEIDKNSEGHAKYHLKVLIGYGDWISYKGNPVFNHHSFEDANTEILGAAIDKAIEESQSRGVYTPQPKVTK